MCGRFTLTVDALGPLQVELDAQLVRATQAPPHRRRFNVAPGDWHWILRPARDDRKLVAPREIVEARWGLVNHWSRDERQGFRQINARAETVATRPAFRSAFARRRCVVLTDGFYEWRGPRTKRMPVRFHAPDGGLLLLAGLYESYTPHDERSSGGGTPPVAASPAAPSLAKAEDPSSGAEMPSRTRTFTIITTEANALVRPLHDRMPVIIEPRDLDGWLDGAPAAAGSLLAPSSPTRLRGTPASPRLNRAGVDDPSVLEAPPEEPVLPLVEVDGFD
ncbi:MAG: SOS response-associated peptidase [Myxococcota bacterium]